MIKDKAKAFVSGMDPTGTASLSMGLKKDYSDQNLVPYHVAGGVVGGAVAVPAVLSGAVHVATAGSAKEIPGLFHYGAKHPFRGLVYHMRASKMINKLQSGKKLSKADKFNAQKIMSSVRLNDLRSVNVGKKVDENFFKNIKKVTRKGAFASIAGMGLGAAIGAGAGYQFHKGQEMRKKSSLNETVLEFDKRAEEQPAYFYDPDQKSRKAWNRVGQIIGGGAGLGVGFGMRSSMDEDYKKVLKATPDKLDYLDSLKLKSIYKSPKIQKTLRKLLPLLMAAPGIAIGGGIAKTIYDIKNG